MPAFISIRHLANNTSKVIKSREPKVITNHGRPVAMLIPIDEQRAAELLAESDMVAS